MTSIYISSWQDDVRNRIYQLVTTRKLTAEHGFVLLRFLQNANHHTGRVAQTTVDQLTKLCTVDDTIARQAMRRGAEYDLIEPTGFEYGARVYRLLSSSFGSKRSR